MLPEIFTGPRDSNMGIFGETAIPPIMVSVITKELQNPSRLGNVVQAISPKVVTVEYELHYSIGWMNFSHCFIVIGYKERAHF